MRTLAALLLLAPLSLAQQPAAAPAAAPAAPAVPQLVPPVPLPGDPLPDGAEWKTTASGLRYVVLAKGDDTKGHPARGDLITAYYAGFLENGKKVDSRLRPATPMSILDTHVVSGWTEGLQLMSPGARFKFHIPYQLAYGQPGRLPLVPANANLVFDIELVSFAPDPTPKFSLPDDKDLTATASGLKYVVLKPGKPDGKRPGPADTVTANHAGWLTDGTNFDSSYAEGGPATFAVSQVFKGLIEGLQLMQEGETCKFVVPASLGYGDRGRSPIPGGATLVFEVELVKVGS